MASKKGKSQPSGFVRGVDAATYAAMLKAAEKPKRPKAKPSKREAREKLRATPKLGAFPGEREAKEARRRVVRAKPEPRLPKIPTIEKPSREQVRAAQRLASRAVSRDLERSAGKGVGSGAARRERLRELEEDPRTKGFREARQHYGKVASNRAARTLARRAGVPKGQRVAEGRKLAQSLKEFQQERDQVREGRPTPKIQAAGLSIDLGDVKRELKKPFERGDEGPRKFAGNFARNVRDLPANVVSSLYVPAREVARGNPKGAAKMLAEPFIETAKNPEKAFLENPLNTGLMVAGGGRGVSLGAGKAVRVVTGKRGKGPVVEVPNTHVREQRPAPKGLVGRAAHPKRRVMTDSEIKRRVDETFAASEDIRRIDRGETVKATRKAVGRKPSAGVPLVAQNIVTSKADLSGYLLELERIGQSLTGAKRRANREAQQQIRVALRQNFGKTEVAARKYAEMSRGLQAKLVEAGLLDRAQAERATLMPYATRKMGAKHDEKIGLYVEQPKSTVYHGSPHGPETIQARGLRASKPTDKPGVNEPHGVYFHPEPRAARAYGRYIYAVDESAVKLVDDPSMKGAKYSPTDIPPGSLKYLGRADDFNEKLLSKLERERPSGVDRVPLSTEAIRAHMAANRVSEPAFLTHAPSTRGARNFYVSTAESPKMPSGKRTGKAVTEGTFDLHPDVLVENAARAQGLVTAAKRYGDSLAEFGYRSKGGKLKVFTSYRQAKQAVADMDADVGGVKFVPVRATPFQAKKLQLDTLLDRANDPNHPAYRQVWEAMDDALAGKGSDSGPWALIPEAAAQQMRAHISRTGQEPLQRIGNLYGSQWRRVVLSLSPKWITGNVVEAAVRSAVAHAGPRSLYTGVAAKRRLKELDPEAAKELRVRATGGGHFALGRRGSVHTNAEHFAASKLRPVAVTLAKLRRTPGPKQLVDFWGAYTDVVMNQLSGRLESGFQTAMLGKALRDSPLMDGHVVKLSSKAIDQAVRGLRNTNEQAMLGRAVDRMYGKYSKFSPGTRRLVAAYTPFIAWYLNSIRFLADVLPRDHPVLTAVLASANEASREWREDEGLATYIDDAVPGWLQGSIPGKSGSHLRLSRYTPFSLAGDPMRTTADQVMPWISGPLAALDGRDWQGNKLYNDDGSELSEMQKAGAALVNVINGTIPAAAIAQRYAEREGSTTEKLRAEFDPFKFTPGSKKKSSGKLAVPKPPSSAPSAPPPPSGPGKLLVPPPPDRG